MSEPVAKRRPMIDLEEFERRLRRSPATNQWDGRPLVERPGFTGVRMESHQVFEPQGQHSAQARQDAWEPFEAREPRAGERLISGDFAAIEAGLLGAAAMPSSAECKEPDAGAPLVSGDFAAIEAGLLSAKRREAVAMAPQTEASLVFPRVEDRPEHWRYAGDAVASRADCVADEEVRSRFPLYVMAAVIIVGSAGIAASFGSKSGVSSSPEAAIIEAETGPAKLQMGTASSVDVTAQSDSFLSRAPEPSPMAFVNNAEQPVDAPLAQEKQESPPRVAVLDGGSPAPADPGLATTGEASISPPPAQAQAEQPSIAAPIEPQKPRMASVRPDGAVSRNTAPAHVSGAPLPAPRPAALAKASTAKTPAQVKTPAQAAKAAKPGAATEARGHRQAAPTAHIAATNPVASADAAAKPAPAADGQAAAAGAPAPQPNPAFAFIQHAVNSVTTTTDKLLEWGGIGAGPRP